jgi:hypothetical protein
LYSGCLLWWATDVERDSDGIQTIRGVMTGDIP